MAKTNLIRLYLLKRNPSPTAIQQQTGISRETVNRLAKGQTKELRPETANSLRQYLAIPDAEWDATSELPSGRPPGAPGPTLDLGGMAEPELDILRAITPTLKLVAGTLRQFTPEQRAIVGGKLSTQLGEIMQQLRGGESPSRGGEGRGRDREESGPGHQEQDRT